MRRASKRETTSIAITVIGITLRNWPIISFIKAIGKKAKTVVKTEAITGKAISEVPLMAARMG